MKIFDYITHVVFKAEARLCDDISILENDIIIKGAIGEIDDCSPNTTIWVKAQDVLNPNFVYMDHVCIYDLHLLTSKAVSKKWKWARIPTKKIIDYRIAFNFRED